MNIDLLPKSVKAVKKIDSKFYFTGKSCVRGHISKRRISSTDNMFDLRVM